MQGYQIMKDTQAQIPPFANPYHYTYLHSAYILDIIGAKDYLGIYIWYFHRFLIVEVVSPWTH